MLPSEVCPTLEQAAAENDRSIFFVRVIWQESRFNALAVSPKGAQGIAQFMPRTADWRGLSNPFDVNAAKASASYLGDLRTRFGNLGLAAAVYNAGPQRVQDSLSARGGLPNEARHYVQIVTGHAAEEWSVGPTQVNGTLPERVPCSDVVKPISYRTAARLDVGMANAPSGDVPHPGWGVQLVGSASQAFALASFQQLQKAYKIRSARGRSVPAASHGRAMVADSMAMVTPPQSSASERDLRLDLFRGVALWLIFLDHIPENIVSWVTIRNYGFSDATEIFIFISGYTAAFVYGRTMRERGFVLASARILRRAWQVYVAHIFLFTIFMAEIAYVAATFDNPLYAEEMKIFDFLKQPDITIFQALLLKFKPVNMDVLPLYIVLLLLFPPMLLLLLRFPNVALGGSAVVYALAWRLAWNLPAYPNGVWYFNPFAWQLLFVFGAWCALGGARRLGGVLRSRTILAVAIAYLLFAFLITLTWHFEELDRFVPGWLADWMYPIDKTNLDVLRFAHFLAIAAVTVRFVPRDWPWLKSPVLRPAIVCGQHSLEIFCLGVFLAFAGQFVIAELSGGPLLQTGISLLGIIIMIATANLTSWYKGIEGRSPVSRVKSRDADLAGRQA